MILDVIIMFLNIAIILILGSYVFQKKKKIDTYEKYRNQDGLLMRNKNKQ